MTSVEKVKGETICYVPGRDDPPTTTWRGIEFEANKPVPVTDADMIAVARGNRYFQVGSEPPHEDVDRLPETDRQYRAWAVRWLKTVKTTEDLIRHWAKDTPLREKCDVGEDDIKFLGTLIEPALMRLSKQEGLDRNKVNDLWVKNGILSIPWRV